MSTEYEGGSRPEQPARPAVGEDAPRPEAERPTRAGEGPAASPGASSPQPPTVASSPSPISPTPPAPPHASPAPPAVVPPPVPPQPGSTPAASPMGGPPPPPAAPWGAMPAPPAQPRARRGGLLAGVIAATLVAGSIGGGVGYLVADEGDGSSGSTTVAGEESDGDAQARPPESVAGIAEEAMPSVVTIAAGEGFEASTGTGFVFDEEGHILTNNHVVANADSGAALTATFSDGESYEAEVVGRAEGYDVAVIRLTDVAGRDLDPLGLGDSEEVVVGDAAIAIGSPFGLDGTVTTGIISAIDRPVSSGDGMSATSYMNALQTDASINPGNSGGPLLDGDGDVIGINSAIQPAPESSGQSGSIGLGFAIPINQAVRVAQDLIADGEPVYPIIGAVVNTDPMVSGAQIVEEGSEAGEPVTPGGPADQAGLQPGDVITRFGDRLIDSGPTLISEIWSHEPGDRIEVTFERDGQEETTEVVLGERVGDDA
ncbi:S1C family serine protease [Streptomyces sp. 4N509B]|uniref:S1C family serine protease n=1 Tax=Streptomyces sp. 4N509B TaxID=3457413 RepID=UPI003FD3CC0C